MLNIIKILVDHILPKCYNQYNNIVGGNVND